MPVDRSPADPRIVVFVHGWSVTHQDTYGGLPARLSAEAAAKGMNIEVANIYLGRYISFHDEVRVRDIAKAFHIAVQDQLPGLLRVGKRFVCITHSTGGPVIRDWWNQHYALNPSAGICPVSHLIMLAPANFGSALAQLGKGRLGRIKAWVDGVEPGQGVLDWLELGSQEAWDLNTAWIGGDGAQIGPKGMFPFVLTGQSIDRGFYDNLNTYTGEAGSDGVVRVAAANLNASHIVLEQEAGAPGPMGNGKQFARELKVKSFKAAPRTAMRIIGGKAHSGEAKGIMRSVKAKGANDESRETLDSILDCIRVRTAEQYEALCERFLVETEGVQDRERLEVVTQLLRTTTHFFHDKFSMVVFRVLDNEDGRPLPDFDLLLTAGQDADPNKLPKGFFVDRQYNAKSGCITYFINNDVMKGVKAVKDEKGKIVREALMGVETLGFNLRARPDSGFAHYLPGEIKASKELLETALRPNSTTLIEIRLRRVIHKNVFGLDPMTDPAAPRDFKGTQPGEEIHG